MIRSTPLTPYQFAKALLSFFLAFSSVWAGAQTLVLPELQSGYLGKQAEFFFEDGPPLTRAEVQELHRANRFQQGTRDVPGYGIGARSVWFRWSVLNPTAQPLPMHLRVGTTWIDKIDVYLVRDGQDTAHWFTGDDRSGAPGIQVAIGYEVVPVFQPGTSELFVRVESIDPMVIPSELLTPEQAQASLRWVNYGYGLIYGMLLTLIAYNAMLYLGLRESRYFLYCLYLSALLCLDIAYTGHGLAYLWAGQVQLQRYIILILMVVFGSCGWLFASRFLELAENAPLVLRWLRWGAISAVALILTLALADAQLPAALFAFGFFGFASVCMVLLGLFRQKHKRAAGRYFLVAVICGMLGGIATMLTVLGLIPFTTLTYHGLELGVILEANMLALALAYQMRQHQISSTQRMLAEDTANAASRNKSEFLSNMSHEIRTPMNGVIGMIDILQETSLSSDQSRMLGTIQTSSIALLKILNDILDFSKIEAGKLEVESIPMHLRGVVDGVVQLIDSTAKAKSIVLSMHVEPDLPHWVRGDPNRLRQVLINLVSNALKFTANPSERPAQVMLLVKSCTLTDGRHGMRLSVKDNGIGMSAEVLAKLFMPFTQADQTTSRKFGGTGLGLSISQRLIDLMGGSITATSVPGVGSEFIIQLGLEPCEAGQHPPPIPLSEPAQRRTQIVHPQTQHPNATAMDQAVQAQRLILLAEDNETNREVMQEQLRQLGYICEMAEDGAIALQMWQANPGRYALLLSDCHMPNLDGFGLTEAIRATESAHTRLPIIAVTANAMQGVAQLCHARGMDDYISKPLRMAELKTMLDKWLPKRKAETLAVWDITALVEMVGNNSTTHRSLLEKFLLSAERQVAEIRRATLTDDTTVLADAAHSLKSAARSVGALALSELCQRLETAGRNGDAPSCAALVQPLTEAFAAAAHEIQIHLNLTR
jgi:signal transduction histidine kinase/DNA-binding response OmpR family regulator